MTQRRSESKSLLNLPWHFVNMFWHIDIIITFFWYVSHLTLKWCLKEDANFQSVCLSNTERRAARVRLKRVKALFIHSSFSLINEREKGDRWRERAEREAGNRWPAPHHDSSYAGPLEMKRRKWSKYEEKNETAGGRKGKRLQAETESQGDECL